LKSRLFVSLDIPDQVVNKIIDYRDSIGFNPDMRWESKEKHHLTLKFIGDVENNLIEEIAHEIKFVEDFNSIECSFLNFGFFFRNNQPSILWAGLKTDESLTKLIEILEKNLIKFSIPVEIKKFKPHITLLRLKKDPGNDFVNRFKNFTFKPIEFSANTITLFKSELYPEGSKYFKLKNYKLK